MMADVSVSHLLRWAESLAGIARTGLGFTQSLYERERFEEVLKIAADIRARRRRARSRRASWSRSGWPAWARASPATSRPRPRWARWWATTPVEILLVQRADTGVWLYPTGGPTSATRPPRWRSRRSTRRPASRPSRSPSSACSTACGSGSPRIPLYSLVFHCRAVGGDAAGPPARDARRRLLRPRRLPEPLAGGARWVDLAFAAIDGKVERAHFDAPRTEVWRVPPRAATALSGES